MLTSQLKLRRPLHPLYDEPETNMDDMRPVFGSPLGPYHEWFAWRPVNTYDRGWVWLRYVWRRKIQKHSYLDGPDARWWQYKFR